MMFDIYTIVLNTVIIVSNNGEVNNNFLSSNFFKTPEKIIHCVRYFIKTNSSTQKTKALETNNIHAKTGKASTFN